MISRSDNEICLKTGNGQTEVLNKDKKFGIVYINLMYLIGYQTK